MSDIVTRLLLKTNDFDANLEQSKKSVNNFQGGISNMAKSVGSSFMKVAGGIGLAVTAGEGFTKLLNSSQTLGDQTAAAMMSAKTGVDEFFYSLGSGDFTPFLSGMDDIIAKSKDAYGALDQLGNAEISFDYFQGKFDESIAKARLNAKNKQLESDEREKSFKDWDNELKKKEEAGKTVASDALNALTKSIAVGTKLSSNDISLNDFEKVMRIDLMPSASRDEEKDYWKGQYNEYIKLSKKIESDRKVDVVRTNDYGKTKSINNAAKIAQEGAAAKYKDAIIYNKLLNKLSDDDLKKLTSLGKKYYSTSQQIAQQRQEFNESTTEFNNSITAIDKAKAAANKAEVQKLAKEKADRDKNKIPVGSVAELDKLIIEARKKYSHAVSDGARTEALKLIAELEQRKVVLNITAKYNSRDLGEPKIAGLPTEKLDTSKIKLPEYKPIFKKEDVSLNQEYAESLAAVGGIMGSLAGMTNESAAAYLQWGANVVSSIAQAIPAIMSLTTAKTAEAAANSANSAAQIPFVGWLSAAGAALSVVAAMASIPKFATGGIVPGTSFTGDKVPALLNSGEMILNGSQQSNLFKVLNGRLYSSLSEKTHSFDVLSDIRLANAVRLDEKDSRVEVFGNIRIKGSDLDLALSNYMKKTGKKW
ncbi:hypothetical protein [Bacteroides sp.]|uniref:hypothetical protein n=1 Tax=Bacteroides sp. TaxID=29523 RepID=UPI002620A300|nr:hypothetical protein [Bacteroides sp.]MDD3038255.1 hypothetical protein [Bacteroides sp.]